MPWGDIREEIGERAVVGVMNFCNAIRDNLPSIQAMCMDFATVVVWISTQLGYVVSKVAQVAEYIKAHWATIEPIVAGITAAFITYKAVLLITKTASVIATIAQNELNAALMACPINWIALGIAAIIGAMVGTVEDTRHKVDSRVEDNQTLFDIIQNALIQENNLF
jgi:D-mannonate dehydratase